MVTIRAAPPSSQLTLSSRSTRGVTGSPRMYSETPRLPWTASFRKFQYWIRMGWSSPYSCSSSCRVRPCTRWLMKALPGSEWTTTKTPKETTSMVRAMIASRWTM